MVRNELLASLPKNFRFDIFIFDPTFFVRPKSFGRKSPKSTKSLMFPISNFNRGIDKDFEREIDFQREKIGGWSPYSRNRWGMSSERLGGV